MGFAGISWPQLLIIAVIVVMIFGTKRIRQAGGDLGAMIAGFRKESGKEDYGVMDAAKDVRKAKKAVNVLRKIK